MRPTFLQGTTTRSATSAGTGFITVNRDMHGVFEVFVNVGKAGSETLAFSEAIGRLISLVLQLDNLDRDSRVEAIIHQLEDIGGVVRSADSISVPNAIAQVLREQQ